MRYIHLHTDTMAAGVRERRRRGSLTFDEPGKLDEGAPGWMAGDETAN